MISAEHLVAIALATGRPKGPSPMPFRIGEIVTPTVLGETSCLSRWILNGIGLQPDSSFHGSRCSKFQEARPSVTDHFKVHHL